jgi:hypothetical protein
MGRMNESDSYLHDFSGRGEPQAQRYLPRMSEAGVAPTILGWEGSAVRTRRGIRLPDWLGLQDQAAATAIRPLVIMKIVKLHRLGIWHRDLHWENVVVVNDEPFLIDVEHACDVDPSWPCYDQPAHQIRSRLPAHAQHGGVLGSYGMWWGATPDQRWDGRYRPLGTIFGPLGELPAESSP